MKKTIIALVALGAMADIAHAQSNVEIYGLFDLALTKKDVNTGTAYSSNGPSTPSASSPTSDKLMMSQKYSSRIGFRGTEELGGGLKATFQLEKRFNPYDGSNASSTGLDFEGASNVGLAGNFGAVRLGRVNNPLDETMRTFDPFAEFGVASRIMTKVAYLRQSSTARYDSPTVSGFSGTAAYQLESTTTTAASNAGYTALAKYNNGPVALAAGYDKRADSSDSDQWSIAGAYAFGPARVSLIYDGSTLKSESAQDIDQKNWLLGLAYRIGAGTANASFQHLKWEQGSTDRTDKRYGLGYTHDLSKRTSVYAEYSLTKGDNVRATNGGDDSYSAVSIGMTHKF